MCPNSGHVSYLGSRIAPADTQSFGGEGKDTSQEAPEGMATAREAFNRIPTATRDILISHGVFDDVAVLAQLYRQGERLRTRAGR